MEAYVRRLDNFIVLELAGRVDDFHTDVVREELETIVSTGRVRIAIDLGAVTALSARCALAWLDVHEKTLVLGGGIALVGPRGAALELVEASGLATVMPVVRTIEALGDVTFLMGVAAEDADEIRSGRRSPLARMVRWLKGAALFLCGVLASASLVRGEAQAQELERRIEPGRSQESVRGQEPVRVQVAESTAMSLDQAIGLARERSPYVRLARAMYEEKDAAFEIARKSPLPKFTGTLGYLHQSNPNGLTTILNREANTLRSGSSDLDASELQTRNETRIDRNAAVVGIGALQVLYAGGYFDARQDLAERERELGEIEVRLAEFELTALVRDVFLGIVILTERERLLERKAQALASKREALAAAVASRAVNESAATEAEIDELRAKREAREARGEITSLEAQFNALLGRPEGSPVALKLPDDARLGTVASKEPFAAALARHPGLAKGRGRIAAAESHMKLVRSQEMFVPKAFAFGGVDHTRGIGVNARIFNWTVGVGLVVPLYDGGVQAEETRKALALRSQAETGYEIEEAKIKEQARDAERKLSSAREGVELAERARGLAARAVAEAGRAVESAQIPKFRYEEARVKGVEADLAALAARAEVARWQSVIAALAGRAGEDAP